MNKLRIIKRRAQETSGSRGASRMATASVPASRFTPTPVKARPTDRQHGKATTSGSSQVSSAASLARATPPHAIPHDAPARTPASPPAAGPLATDGVPAVRGATSEAQPPAANTVASDLRLLVGEVRLLHEAMKLLAEALGARHKRASRADGMSPTPQPEVLHDQRLLDIGEVCKLVCASRSSVYEWINAKQFVQQIKVGKRAVRYQEADVLAWIEAKKSDPALQQAQAIR